MTVSLGKHRWFVVLLLAVALHAAGAMLMLIQPERPGALGAGAGGIQVGLGPSGSAGGSIAAVAQPDQAREATQPNGIATNDSPRALQSLPAPLSEAREARPVVRSIAAQPIMAETAQLDSAVTGNAVKQTSPQQPDRTKKTTSPDAVSAEDRSQANAQNPQLRLATSTRGTIATVPVEVKSAPDASPATSRLAPKSTKAESQSVDPRSTAKPARVASQAVAPGEVATAREEHFEAEVVKSTKITTATVEAERKAPPKPRSRPPQPKPTKMVQADRKPQKAGRSRAKDNPAAVAVQSPGETGETFRASNTVKTTGNTQGNAEGNGNTGRSDGGAGAGNGDNSAGGGAPGTHADYIAKLQAWLARHQQYPVRARSRRQEGTALLYFAMDRAGRVLDFRVQRSSGHRLLDREVKALIQRAQPLPKLPASWQQSHLELVVPIRFMLR